MYCLRRLCTCLVSQTTLSFCLSENHYKYFKGSIKNFFCLKVYSWMVERSNKCSGTTSKIKYKSRALQWELSVQFYCYSWHFIQEWCWKARQMRNFVKCSFYSSTVLEQSKKRDNLFELSDTYSHSDRMLKNAGVSIKLQCFTFWFKISLFISTFILFALWKFYIQ